MTGLGTERLEKTGVGVPGFPHIVLRMVSDLTVAATFFFRRPAIAAINQ